MKGVRCVSRSDIFPTDAYLILLPCARRQPELECICIYDGRKGVRDVDYVTFGKHGRAGAYECMVQ